MKKFIKYFINIILISVLMFSGYNIYLKLSEYKKSDIVYKDIRKKAEYNKDFELSSINSDYRFWIKVANTNIDYPVVQGKDNDFYLEHDFNKNYLASGSVYLDYRNDFEKDKGVIVYGHHMKNKTMFGELANFKDEKFFKENNKISIEYKDQVYTYEVFSVYVANLSDGDYLLADVKDDDEYSDYLKYICDRSLFDVDFEVDSDDNIITLYTCSYEFKNARTIIHAKRI